jgi:TNF receptor-associated factor 2/TNF receptor-associated factor 3
MLIKGVAERVSPLEALSKTMLSGNTKLNGTVEVLQKALEDMERKSKQQEAQIRALKAKLEQRSVASSWETGHVTSGGEMGINTDRVVNVEKKFEDLERQVASLKVHVSELELQLQASLASTHNGAFLWRIPEIARRKRDAIEERVTSIYSPPFYTGRNGYKMCIRAYLNGDGMGYKTHLSIFFVLMKGEFDPLLKWPFEYKVSLILVDQNHRKHIVQTFKPTLESNSFQRPVTDMNVASGCPQFAKLTALEDDNYVKDDVIFIKCIIDTSKIFHP